MSMYLYGRGDTPTNGSTRNKTQETRNVSGPFRVSIINISRSSVLRIEFASPAPCISRRGVCICIPNLPLQVTQRLYFLILLQGCKCIDDSFQDAECSRLGTDPLIRFLADIPRPVRGGLYNLVLLNHRGSSLKTFIKDVSYISDGSRIRPK
jgi:hypothetical protein